MSPVSVGAIGAYIREQREQAKISLRQLAQSAGISNPYLSQIERGLRRPSADILQQIAKGLRISAEALYVQAGFLEDRPPGSMVRDAVLSDEELTDRQKQMLIEIYESFRRETAIARAGVAGPEDEADLSPDEAALIWPENLTPSAVADQPRRLALAVAPDEWDDDGSGDQDSAGQGSEGRGSEGRGSADQGSADQGAGDEGPPDEGAGPGQSGTPPGGTIHPFPPPSATR